MKRVIVFQGPGTGLSLVEFLMKSADAGFELYGDPANVVQAVLASHPDAILWGIRRESESDLATLSLIRLVAPEIPLLLVEPRGRDLAPEVIAELRPAFVGRLPENQQDLLASIEGLATCRAIA